MRTHHGMAAKLAVLVAVPAGIGILVLYTLLGTAPVNWTERRVELVASDTWLPLVYCNWENSSANQDHFCMELFEDQFGFFVNGTFDHGSTNSSSRIYLREPSTCWPGCSGVGIWYSSDSTGRITWDVHGNLGIYINVTLGARY